MVAKFSIRNLSFRYNGDVALRDVTLDIPANQITVLFGPSHAGKSTLLRCLNRLNDLIENEETQLSGQILLDGQDIYAPRVDVTELRRRVGMVFALPIPLPLTIHENVTYGPRMQGERRPARLDELVERSLRQAALWDEVKDRLHEPALRLSGGQQQRLCIARTLALEPDVILLDNPTSGLDPLSTAKVENSLQELKTGLYHRPGAPQRAAGCPRGRPRRLSAGGRTGGGRSRRGDLYPPPGRRTEDYVTGRFG